MDDWKLRARTSVKLEKDFDMFVSPYLVLFMLFFPFHYSKRHHLPDNKLWFSLLVLFGLSCHANKLLLLLVCFILFFVLCRPPNTPLPDIRLAGFERLKCKLCFLFLKICC